MQIWNEYFTSFSTDKPQSAQVSEELSRVSDCVDTRLALDKSGDTANFDYRLMNENNNEKVLNIFQICPNYGRLRLKDFIDEAERMFMKKK
jgi:hypothetical protein